MNWYETIKYYYNQGYYTKEQVAVFVKTGRITPVQYESITGIPYKEE